MTTARIVVHDYSGHPGQAQLSRALARRGFDVTHQHCPSYATGKGSLRLEPGDPATLSFEPCAMEGAFAKYSALTRIRQELVLSMQTLLGSRDIQFGVIPLYLLNDRPVMDWGKDMGGVLLEAVKREGIDPASLMDFVILYTC